MDYWRPGGRVCLADALLHVPMCDVLLFFWFAFLVLAYGANVVVLSSMRFAASLAEFHLRLGYLHPYCFFFAVHKEYV